MVFLFILKMTVNDFQVVVLAAGRGSRMTELTAGRPKCLLPVGGKPMLYHSLKVLENIGFEGRFQHIFPFLSFY